MDRDVLIGRLRELRGRLERDGVTHVAMYGSRSRGDHRADSDVDLLIEVDETQKFSLLDLVGAEATLSDALLLPVSIVMRRSIGPKFAERIADDVVEIF